MPKQIFIHRKKSRLFMQWLLDQGYTVLEGKGDQLYYIAGDGPVAAVMRFGSVTSLRVTKPMGMLVKQFLHWEREKKGSNNLPSDKCPHRMGEVSEQRILAKTQKSAMAIMDLNRRK